DRKCTVLYRHILAVVQTRSAEITTVKMSSKKQYQCTKPLLYSAARMLVTIAYHLRTALHPDQGVKLSYREIGLALLGEYSEDFLAVAGRLLVQIGLLESPCQDHTTRRAFIWKMPHEEIQQTLAGCS